MDIFNESDRRIYITEILGFENKKRKEEHRKRFEVFRDRAEPWLQAELLKEFKADTVEEMRQITSINLCKRITNEKASLYNEPPTRTFATSSGAQASESQVKQIENLYKYGRVNTRLKRANKWFELHHQCAIQVLPKNGVIQTRVYQPHQYDVIPMDDDPEVAKAYVISVDDRSFMNGVGTTGTQTYELKSVPTNSGHSPLRSSTTDSRNQNIADYDDAMKAKMRFVWWSAEGNFITDGHGKYIDPTNNQIIENPPQEMIENPLGVLTFIDVSWDKDNEFWERAGSSSTEFDLDFKALLTDAAFIHKMQGYSQAIIYAPEPPANMKVGPNRILHIPQDPNSEVQARFEWSSPNSNIGSSLELIETFLRLYLTSEGVDPKTISGKAEGQAFSSGIERLLAMLDRFEASRDTMDLFTEVEQKLLTFMIMWSNLMQTVNAASPTTVPLIPDLRGGALPEDMVVTVQFYRPEALQTKTDMEDSIIKLIDAGLKSRVDGIMELEGVDRMTAMSKLKEIDEFAVSVGTGNQDSGTNMSGDVDGQGQEAQA